LSKVKTFLSNYQNQNTKRNLRVSITNYFEAMYGEAKRKQLDNLAEKYFNENRDYEKDVEAFLNHLNGSAPLTIKLKISNVKTFLLENNVELPQKFWRKINRRIKGSRALTLDRIPTSDELKKLLLHMPIQGKATFLTLESSGMRIGELLQSHIDDLYLNEEPARIQLRGEITKTGNPRHIFFSREAEEALTEWLKVREDYLKSAVGKSHLYDKDADDNRIFPFDSSTAYSIWGKALHKSGLNGKDKSTGREKIHPHTLRKFFRTRLGAAGIPIDVVEALMGHESALLVFTEAQEVTKLRQEVEERNKSLQTNFIKLSTKNLTLENKLARMERENLETKEKLKTLETVLTEVLGKIAKMSSTEN